MIMLVVSVESPVRVRSALQNLASHTLISANRDSWSAQNTCHGSTLLSQSKPQNMVRHVSRFAWSSGFSVGIPYASASEWQQPKTRRVARPARHQNVKLECASTADFVRTDLSAPHAGRARMASRPTKTTSDTSADTCDTCRSQGLGTVYQGSVDAEQPNGDSAGLWSIHKKRSRKLTAILFSACRRSVWRQRGVKERGGVR